MKDKLQNSELVWQNVFAAANDAILVLDSGFSILACNARAEEMYGWTAAEMMRKTLSDLRPSTMRAELPEQMRRAAAAGGGRWETLHQHANGKTIDVEVTTRPFNIANEQRFVHIVRDMSAQRKAEAELRDRERRLRMLVRQLPAALWALDRNLIFLSSSGSLLPSLGLEASAMQGASLFDYVSVNSVSADAHRAALSGISGSFTFEYLAHWLECHVEPMLDEHGESCGCLGLAVDITGRMAAEENIRFQASLLDQVRNAVIATDLEGRVSYWNRFAEATYRWSADEARGRSALELTVPEESLPAAIKILTALKLGKTWEGELRAKRKDGTIFDAHAIKAPLLGRDGRPIGFISVSYDVTAEKKAQDQLRRSQAQLRALTDRINTVREGEARRIARELHDVLGQQLTALKMELALLPTCKASEQPIGPTSPLEKLERLVDRSIETVQKISGEIRHAHLDRLGLRAAIASELEDFRGRTGIHDGTMHLDEIEGIDARCAIAVFRISQEALTNIARHAKATAVDVLLCRSDNNLLLQVRDNGRGISDAELSDVSTLGLLGMRERAQAVGGWVQVRRESNSGTTVEAQVPLSPVESPHAPAN